MRRRLILLLAAAGLVLLPSAAQARTGVRIGIGDQQASMFDQPAFQRAKFRRVRYFVAWNAMDDTAARLADAHGISESAVVGFNPKLRRLKSGRLAPGQAILIPTAAVASAALHVPDPSIEKYPGSTKKMKVHAVKKGETIGAIAKKYGTSSDRIMKLNGLKKPMIFPGQSLIVSGASVKSKSGKSGKLTKSSKASKSTKRRSKPSVKTPVKTTVKGT